MCPQNRRTLLLIERYLPDILARWDSVLADKSAVSAADGATSMMHLQVHKPGAGGSCGHTLQEARLWPRAGSGRGLTRRARRRRRRLGRVEAFPVLHGGIRFLRLALPPQHQR